MLDDTGFKGVERIINRGRRMKQDGMLVVRNDPSKRLQSRSIGDCCREGGRISALFASLLPCGSPEYVAVPPDQRRQNLPAWQLCVSISEKLRPCIDDLDPVDEVPDRINGKLLRPQVQSDPVRLP